MKIFVFLLVSVLLTSCASIGFMHTESKLSFSVEELNSAKPIPVPPIKYIESNDKIKLAYREYIPKDISAILIFYHGATGHSGASYPHIGNDLKDKNILTITPDRRGHGYFGGDRGDTPTVEQIYEDVNVFIKNVRNRYPDKPIFLSGHSSGGGLLLNYASYDKKEKVDGYLFIAPYLGFLSQTAKEMETPFVTEVKTDLFMENGRTGKHGNSKAIFFNVTKETLKRFPRFISAITVNMANATTPMAPALQIKNLDSPVGLWIGSDDEVFDAQKLVSFVNRNNPDVETEIIEGEKHLSIILSSSKYIGKWISRKLNK